MLHLPPSPCPIFPGTVQSGRYGSEKIQIRQISSSTQREKSSQLVRYIHHLKTEHLKSEHLTFWTLFCLVFKQSDLVIMRVIQKLDIFDHQTDIFCSVFRPPFKNLMLVYYIRHSRYQSIIHLFVHFIGIGISLEANKKVILEVTFDPRIMDKSANIFKKGSNHFPIFARPQK